MLGQIDTFVAFAIVMLGVSLSITVLNQMTAAAVGLRGSNLRWGLKTLLEQGNPALRAHAQDIANEVLHHPLISDSTCSRARSWPVVGWMTSRWRLASAIRIEELLSVLEEIAERETPAAPPKVEERRRAVAKTRGLPGEPIALAVVDVYDDPPEEWRTHLKNAVDANRKQSVKRLKEALEALSTLPAGANAQVDTLAPQLAARVRHAAGDLERAFNAVMDRATQRFAFHMRLWTVFWSVVIAFMLHLDASALLQQIRTDPQLRARLVASTDALTADAGRVLEASMPAAFTTAIGRLRAETPGLLKQPAPATISSRADGVAWIRSLSLPDEATLVGRYDELVQQELRTAMGDLALRAQAIRTDMDTAGLQVIPDYSRHVGKDGRSDLWLFGTGGLYGHFFGVLFSAILLSLGAPFWFNVLKTAATLRPVVATRQKT